jgi:type I site-specific restriction endonuclease
MFFIGQQQRAMQLQQQQQMQRQAEVNNVFSSEESMQKVKALLTRISASVEKSSSFGVDKWTAEERESYFERFNNHPVLETMSKAGEDANSRISKLFELSDADLDDIMRMQMVMVEDMKVQGTIAKRIREAQVAMWSAAAKAKRDGVEVSAVLDEVSPIQRIGGLMASLGSLTNYGRQMEMPSHGHGDDGHVCSMHPGRQQAPDVSSGKADRMER